MWCRPWHRKEIQRETAMGTRLYVGNIPYGTTDANLRELFGQNGREVTDVKIITDRETGQSRGFAFVEMAKAEDATAVVNELNGSSMGGRSIVVNEARERTPGGGGGGGGGPRSFGGPRPGGFGGGGYGGPGGGGYGGRGPGGPGGGPPGGPGTRSDKGDGRRRNRDHGRDKRRRDDDDY